MSNIFFKIGEEYKDYELFKGSFHKNKELLVHYSAWDLVTITFTIEYRINEQETNYIKIRPIFNGYSPLEGFYFDKDRFFVMNTTDPDKRIAEFVLRKDIDKLEAYDKMWRILVKFIKEFKKELYEYSQIYYHKSILNDHISKRLDKLSSAGG